MGQETKKLRKSELYPVHPPAVQYIQCTFPLAGPPTALQPPTRRRRRKRQSWPPSRGAGRVEWASRSGGGPGWGGGLGEKPAKLLGVGLRPMDCWNNRTSMVGNHSWTLKIDSRSHSTPHRQAHHTKEGGGGCPKWTKIKQNAEVGG